MLGKDVVPRVGLHQLETLRHDLMDAIKRSKKNKVSQLGTRQDFRFATTRQCVNVSVTAKIEYIVRPRAWCTNGVATTKIAWMQ